MSFAHHLGYLSFDDFLEKVICFEANLETDSAQFLLNDGQNSYLKDKNDTPLLYSQLTEKLLSAWQAQDGEKSATAFFDIATLKAANANGKKFLYGDFSCIENGVRLHKQLSCKLCQKDGNLHGTFFVFDTTEHTVRTASLNRRAEYDLLTELYNRNAADFYIQEYFNSWPEEEAAIVLIDVDNFRNFNDRFGHHIGDIIMKDAAKNLMNHLGNNSILGRNGGDEFIALLKDRNAHEVLDEIKRFSECCKAVEHEGKTYKYTLSIGYALYPEHGIVYHDLAKKANQAVLSVKSAGKNNVQQFKERENDE